MNSNYRLIIYGFLCLIFLFRTVPVFADTVPVSASIPDLSFNPPVLLTPTANATLTTSQPTFTWSRPSPIPANPLSYYDLYLDGAIFSASISDSLTAQDYYFYSTSATGGIFTLALKTDLTQGYHTWKVTAYTENGVSSSSETRTFYLDSVSPFISVSQVDQQALTWNTDTPSSIPSLEHLYLSITTPNPLLTGGVETSANLQILLLCPVGVSACQTQIFSGNISSGLWETQFANLLPDQVYTVQISATDAAGNSTVFPDFFLIYGVVVTPTSTPTPTSFPTLTLPSLTVTPPLNQLNIITPTSYIPQTPPTPTPPPVKPPKAPGQTRYLFYLFLLILMVFGLPLHLLMSIFGTSTPLRFIFKFLIILAFPFLRKRKYQTVPFSFIDIYISDKLDHTWKSVVTDIKGFYTLPTPIPEDLLIEMSSLGRNWKTSLYKGSNIPTICLIPLLTKPQNDRTRLQINIHDHRDIPLIIALLTSITAFLITPSYFILVYNYLSLQYLFSEYIYPKL